MDHLLKIYGKPSSKTNKIVNSSIIHETPDRNNVSLVKQKKTKLFRLAQQVNDLKVKYELLKKTSTANKAEAQRLKKEIRKSRQVVWDKRDLAFDMAMKFHSDHSWDGLMLQLERGKHRKENNVCVSKPNSQATVEQLKLTLTAYQKEIDQLKLVNLKAEKLSVKNLVDHLHQLQMDTNQIVQQTYQLKTEIHKVTSDIQECEQIQGMLFVDDVNIEMEVNVNISVTKNEKLRSILKKHDCTNYNVCEKTHQPAKKRIKFTSPAVTRTILISPNRLANYSPRFFS